MNNGQKPRSTCGILKGLVMIATAALRKLIRRYRKAHMMAILRKRGNVIPMSCSVARDVELSQSTFGEEARIAHHASVRVSKIGRLTSIGRYSKITHAEIGSYCAIAWDCTINAINHPYSHLTISAFPYVPYVGGFVKERTQEYEKVIIGNDVWVGAHAVIMPGVRVGNGAIIGAGAVVTKDVPDYAIVVGVPAKIVKYRFAPDVIQRLLQIKWWDLEKQVIKDNIDLFQGEFTRQKLDSLERLRDQ